MFLTNTAFQNQFPQTVKNWHSSYDPSVFNNVWYFDPVNGSMSNDGTTPETAWTTPQDAKNANMIEYYTFVDHIDDGGEPTVVNNSGAAIKGGDKLVLLAGDHTTLSGWYQMMFLEHLQFVAVPGTVNFTEMVFRNTRRMYFYGITFSRPDGEATTRLTPNMVTLQNRNNSGGYVQQEGDESAGNPKEHRFVNCTFEDGRDYSTWTNQNWIDNTHWNGIFTEDECHYISVDNCSFDALDIAYSNYGDWVYFCNSEVNHITADGIRILGSNFYVVYNKIGNSINIDANHNDCFQSWVRDGQSVVKNGYIYRNILYITDDLTGRDNYTWLQGVGFFDGPYQDIVVRDNSIVTYANNAIGAYDWAGCTIEDNVIMSPEFPYSPYFPYDPGETGDTPQEGGITVGSKHADDSSYSLPDVSQYQAYLSNLKATGNRGTYWRNWVLYWYKGNTDPAYNTFSTVGTEVTTQAQVDELFVDFANCDYRLNRWLEE